MIATRSDMQRLVRGVMLAITAMAVAGCLPESQKNRPKSFTPGVYQGQKMEPLSDEQNKALQRRGLLQQ